MARRIRFRRAMEQQDHTGFLKMKRSNSFMSTVVSLHMAVSIVAVPVVARAKPLHPVIDAVTFADRRGKLYVPLRDAARELGLQLGWDSARRSYRLNQRTIQPSSLKTTLDGTHLIPLKSLVALGARAAWAPKEHAAIVSSGAREITVRDGKKHVQVDRPSQTLKAWQGSRLVLKSRISTGREFGSTPAGIYPAGPIKQPVHHSRIAKGAIMPWSIQVKGDVIIHGFDNVPGRPVSRGCIRLPLTGGNPARWFYHWVDIGTPIQINGPHKAGKKRQVASRR